ncbi:MAG: OmpA family protein [Myxococcales bacterium]|jgi:outer membrane protein OmpA-like peptidoglycan-associated protein
MPTAGRAQRAIDPQTFLPAPAPGDAVTLPSPRPLTHGATAFGLALSYATDALQRPEPGGASTDLITDLAQLEALAAAGLYDVVEIGVAVPWVLSRVADDFSAIRQFETRTAPGDLRLSAAAPLLRGEAPLSLRFTASLPTGDDANAQGARNWTATPALVIGAAAGPVRLTAALAYRFRERTRITGADLEQDDELELGLGAAAGLTGALDARLELRGRAGFMGERSRDDEHPVEGDLGLHWAFSPHLSLLLGAGTALWPGTGGYGAPDLRLFGMLRAVQAPRPSGDRPGDRDGDGLPDADDGCPDHAEDEDGFADDDGCPDPDNDADGFPDRADRCPTRSEDRDGFQDDDGCPDPDDDEDSIADGLDACPMDPEDADGYQDADGCPEPGPARSTITVGDSRILVSERVYFDYDRDTLRDVSLPLLDRLAEVIRELPEGTRVIVEGHTDDVGDPDYNLELSYRRARAVVVYLQSRGVPEARLGYRGRGSQDPVTDDRSPAGRALNRRVEFILER